MNTYRIWLKDGQSFDIKADRVDYNGDDVMFFNKNEDLSMMHKHDDIGCFNLRNIGGWAKIEEGEHGL